MRSCTTRACRPLCALWLVASGAPSKRDTFPNAFAKYLAEAESKLREGDED